MKKYFVKAFALMLSGAIALSLAGCGAKVTYESFYEDVPGSSGQTQSGSSSGGNSSSTNNSSTDGQTSGGTVSGSSKMPSGKTNYTPDQFLDAMPKNLKEIGRASCRERV